MAIVVGLLAVLGLEAVCTQTAAMRCGCRRNDGSARGKD